MKRVFATIAFLLLAGVTFGQTAPKTTISVLAKRGDDVPASFDKMEKALEQDLTSVGYVVNNDRPDTDAPGQYALILTGVKAKNGVGDTSAIAFVLVYHEKGRELPTFIMNAVANLSDDDVNAEAENFTIFIDRLIQLGAGQP